MLVKWQFLCQKDLSQRLSFYADSVLVLSDKVLPIVQFLNSSVCLLDSRVCNKSTGRFEDHVIIYRPAGAMRETRISSRPQGNHKGYPYTGDVLV